jgi:hypothetical protein
VTFDPHKNLAYSTVATPPSPAVSGTSLVLSAGDGGLFPDPSTDGAFNVTIWPTGAIPTAANAEIARCTARTTDTLTLTRAQEGTSARTIVAGDQIAATITAKTFTDIENVLPVKVYDQTLGADAASIDTGAVIPAGYAVLEVWIVGRTAEAIVNSGVIIRVNGDSGINYDFERAGGASTTVNATSATAGTSWSSSLHGANGEAGVAGMIKFTIPGYAGTTFQKVGEMAESLNDSTAANQSVQMRAIKWRSTAAITRVSVAPNSGSNLKAGTRLIVFVR